MRRKILLGLTGSVATVLYEKLIQELQQIGDVTIILTESAKHFVDDDFLKGVKVFTDKDEWKWYSGSNAGKNIYTDKWNTNDPILHIKLRDTYSALVIAPCSMNTLAKIVNGFCDNLLTSVVRAWYKYNPIIIAPAANTVMWEHPITKTHINSFLNFSENNYIVNPQRKLLACGEYGMGAMAEIDEICKVVKESLKWNFPLREYYHSQDYPCPGIPVGNHPGAFGFQRKYDRHTGVDLYTKENTLVFPVEPGRIVGVEHFTGEQDKSPWWNNTDCILVEGPTGVICYGEIEVNNRLFGYEYKFSEVKYTIYVDRNTILGKVIPVLKDKEPKKHIPGHSLNMLHMELYAHGRKIASDGFDENILNDPTPFLLEMDAYTGGTLKKLTMP